MLIAILILQVLLIVHTIYLRFELEHYRKKIKKQFNSIYKITSEKKSDILKNQMLCNSIFNQTKRIIHKQKLNEDYISAFNFVGKMMDKFSKSANLEKILEYADDLEKESEVKDD
ncbi:hypothetical protein [Wocania ichthyoenteri]|uniref:hypothetical protein n=1 Tax=Wocania ichthyoenteri TaxID=1230531 RepID=UPI00053DF2BD|nr:hypothetical protein [Wocania ichthyoenteri]